MTKEKVFISEADQYLFAHRATIYNELKRGGTPYRAEVAQRSL